MCNTDEEDFIVGIEYAYDNLDANIEMISEEMGIAKDNILLVLRKGKLVLKGEKARRLNE